MNDTSTARADDTGKFSQSSLKQSEQLLQQQGLTSAEVAEIQRSHGFNEVKAAETPEWRKILMRYLDWVCIVIIVAAIISIAVPNHGDRGYTSFVLLMIELNLVVWVGWYTDRNAGSAIKELEALAAPTAEAKRDGAWSTIPVRELVPGDLIALKGGDVIPADCQLVGKGEPLKIDESSLTGESMAVSRSPGDKVLAGAVVESGELEALVTATGAGTFFGKTLSLLGGKYQRGHLQQVLGRVSAGLGLLGLVGCLAILGVMLGRDYSTEESLVIFFVILVSCVPIGMPVVTGAVLAVGAREMARENAIVSRLSALEELSGMEVLCSDKTGTLTLNRLTLDKHDIQAWGSHTADDVLLFAALSARWTNGDAIDRAVTASVEGGEAATKGYTFLRVTPFDPVSKKTLAEVITPGGEEMTTVKGAPQIIRDLLHDAEARIACDDYIAERASRGLRSLGVARSDDGGSNWTLVGLISLLDPPRPDSGDTIRLANSLGVEVKMVTGDQHAIAVETARRLGMGTNILEGTEIAEAAGLDQALIERVQAADGFAGVYPEHKYRIVEALQAPGALIGMTGDGVNDAPALKKANVGIAVAGATAAARGAADIILLDEGIGTIIKAMIRSRKIFRRLETYIIYRLVSSLVILGIFFFLFMIPALRFEFPTWALVLISLTNDLSAMATSFDKVHSSEHPEKWDMTKALVVGLSISVIGIGSQVLLYILANPNLVNWWHIWGLELPEETNPELRVNAATIAIDYFSITCFVQLSIFLTRNPSLWWHFSRRSAPRPSWVLTGTVLAFVTAAFFIGAVWPRDVQPDGGISVLAGAGYGPIGVVLFYCFVFLQIADVAKVAAHRLFDAAERATERAHHAGARPPAWVRTLYAPSTALEHWIDSLETAFAECLAGCAPGRKRAVQLPPAGEAAAAEAGDLEKGVNGSGARSPRAAAATEVEPSSASLISASSQLGRLTAF